MLIENFNLICYVLGGSVLLLLIWNILLQSILLKLRRNQHVLFSGKNGKDLEKILIETLERTKCLENEITDLHQTTKQIGILASKGLHKTGMIRFNPFRDIGGDQSFSIALLDGENNGLVLSSLYSREGVRVYAKSIAKGISQKYPLTQEEKYAISIASAEKNNQKSKRSI